MTDYTTPSGAGQLMIRDQGSTVEFWVYAGYNLQWNNLRFNVDANGTTTYFTINYHASQVWQQVGAITVSTSQTITYRLLDATGTTSIGGPTSMSVALSRGTVPGPPGTPTVLWTNASQQVGLRYNAGSDGGRPLDVRRIGYGTSASAPQAYVNTGDTITIGGLAKGTTYYFWAQAHNALGWGPLSGRAQVTTWREPDAPKPVGISAVTQTSLKYQFNAGASAGGTGVLEWQIGYGTSSASPTTFLSSSGISTITGLQPATGYYVWSRGRNAVGWSPWSARLYAVTVAGAWVRVGTGWKQAIPYVKVNGVWKVARPWSRQAGVWKETQ